MTTDLIPSLKNLWKTVFGDPDSFVDAFFDIAFAPDRCHYAVEDDQIVSALYWFDCEYEGRKLAYIYAVATAPEHRGKGLASRLLKETHDHLKALGYSGAVLKPAAGLFPFYERLGYVTSGFVRRVTAEAASIPATAKEVSAAQYGALRRQFLPEKGILQEGVTLTFLHTFAHFFAAEDALVCVARGESVIFEYLGNPNSAPGILAALGIKKAVLPGPGGDIPFAMYHPLDASPAPGYLGITLE